MKKRLLSLVLCLVMVFSLVPFAASAEYKAPVTANGATITNPNTAYTTRRDLVLDKTLTANNDGTFDLKLESYATGKVTTSVVTTQIPTDFILVVDQSGSMAYQDMPTDYQAVTTPAGGWKLSDFDGGKDTDGNSADKEYYFYDQNTGDYYRVYRKWGDLFELVPRNSMYVQEVINRRGLGWFQQEENEEQDFTSQYYYRPAYDPLINTLDPAVANDWNFYPVTITATGGKLTYYIKFKYTDKNGTARTAKFYNGTNFDANNREASDAVLYYNGLTGGFGPGDSFAGFGYNRINNAVLYHVDNNSLTGALGVLLGNTTQPQKARDKYTFANITRLTTGMYIQNPLFIRHVGYNALAYRDANGVEHLISSTDYCDKQGNPTGDDHGTTTFTFNATLYEAKGAKESRLQAMKNALTAFVDNVAKQTDDNGPVDHRVAIVGFSSNETTYNNTEIMTNEGFTASNNNGIAKRNASDSTYEKALISARANDQGAVNSGLTAAIANLTANGGTQPEDGLDMAYSILNNSIYKDEYAAKTRNAVVIFFTDGRPGQNSESNQYTEANEVVASAWNIKRDFTTAQIYSVGVFGEADGNPLTYFEDLTNWWGASTTRVFLEKQRLEEDRIAAGADDNASVSPSLNNYRDYLEYAEKTYYADFHKEEGTIEPTTFTYSWTTGSLWWQESHSVPVTGYVHTISGTFWRECIRNATGYPAQQNDTIADYMTVVSSTYPQAKTFDGGWYNYSGNSTYNTIVNGARGAAVNKMYYSLCSDSQRLTDVFVNIAENVDTAGSTIDLDGSAQLRDIVNTNVFDMPTGANAVTAYAVSASARNENGNIIYTFGTDHEQDFTPTVENGTVSVSGFDYSSHYVMENPPAGVTGQKLIVEIKGLTLKDEVNGEVLSNNEAGIYATKQEDGQTVISNEPTLAIDSPKLTIAGAVNPTFVIDFNAPMTVATGVKQLKQVARENPNGSFTKEGETAVYKLNKALDHPTAGSTTNLVLSGVDTAMVYGVPVGETGSAAWNKITTVPAGSVYFDDDFSKLTEAIDVGDGSGYNAGVTATPTDENTAKGRYEFTFNGTGIDVYCTTDTDGGMVQYMIDGQTSTAAAMKNYSVTERYNVPTISVRDLSQGTHTLTINVLGSSNYKLDGIRVYNPVSNETYEGQGTHEQYATFINLREALVNDAEGDHQYQDSTGNVTIHDEVAITGALFVDDTSKLTRLITATDEQLEDPQYAGKIVYVDAQGNQVEPGTAGALPMINAYADEFEAYKENSPKHEIYLKNNEAITFVLTAEAAAAAESGNLWIGLSAPDAGKQSGTVEFKAGVTQQIRTAVDEYYPITPDRIGANNTVTIKNTGDNMISVTNLKITGNQAIYNAAITPKAGTESVSEDAVILSVEDVVPMVFEPVTMQTVKIAANNGVDPDASAPDPTPSPDPTPDPTEQPAQNWLSQLISSFVNALFKSIARLFNP